MNRNIVQRSPNCFTRYSGMSDIVEKTLASLPSLITGVVSSRSIQTTRGFASFVDNLSRCRTRYEINEFLRREVDFLKDRLSRKDISLNQIKDGLVRSIFCCLMGHNVVFAQIYAVKLAQQGSLAQKRVGYLASSLLLSDQDEMVIMLVNTIQKDLQSSNVVEICAGLTAAGKLISQELIPAILPLVEAKITHQKVSVRKRAVMCLHSFYRKAPSLLEHSDDNFKKALCDKDPGVMWAALQIYQDMIELNPTKHEQIAYSLIHILEQVISRHFPGEFEHSNIPAPWLQIQILHILACLGTDNDQISCAMYPVLIEVLQRIDPMQRMGLAVIYECVKTIVTIKPDNILLDRANQCITKFLSARNINLKYLGVKSLSLIVKVNPSYAIPHQDIVIECLEHADQAIRRKVLELLYSMCCAENVKVVCQKLMDNISTTSDKYIRSDLVSKILLLTKKFCIDILWYVEIVNALVVKASQHVTHNAVNTIMRALKYHLNENSEMRESVLQVYWHCLKNEANQPDEIFQIAVWILGEYQHHVSSLPASEVLAHLEHLYLNNKLSACTRHIILTAMTKIIGRSGANGINLQVMRRLNTCTSEDAELIQRIDEIITLTKNTALLQRVVTMEVNVAEVDSTLSFMDGYVCDKLENGAKAYLPRNCRVSSPAKKGMSSPFSDLNLKAYDSPMHASNSGKSTNKPMSLTSSGGSSDRNTYLDNSEPVLKMTGIKRVWSKDGIKDVALEVYTSPVGSETSSPQRSHQNREQKERNELASALFGGIMSVEENMSK
ncbi:AP-4 complex subunit epsilon-1-like [Tubulanus polymorphus]|uniref:AP-4 complex subunit epsilon-1-like n=1 Tax=Tubulanus polymorphus TaxID=672921 RepID=UPI003DA3E37F